MVRLTKKLKKGFTFYITSQVTLFFIVLFSYCFLLPPIFQGYQIMFCLWLILPCLAFTFFFSPYDHEIMTHMPGRDFLEISFDKLTQKTLK